MIALHGKKIKLETGKDPQQKKVYEFILYFFSHQTFLQNNFSIKMEGQNGSEMGNSHPVAPSSLHLTYSASYSDLLFSINYKIL